MRALILALVLAMAATVQAEFITSDDASVMFSSNFINDLFLSIEPNFDGSDETYAGSAFFGLADPANFWVAEIADADGSFHGADDAQFLEFTITFDAPLSGPAEVAWMSHLSGLSTSLIAEGGVWDSVWSGPGNVTTVSASDFWVHNRAGSPNEQPHPTNPILSAGSTGLTVRIDNREGQAFNGILAFPNLVTAVSIFETVPEPSAFAILLAGLPFLPRRRRD